MRTLHVFTCPRRTCASALRRPKMSVADHVAHNAAKALPKMRVSDVAPSQWKESKRCKLVSRSGM